MALQDQASSFQMQLNDFSRFYQTRTNPNYVELIQKEENVKRKYLKNKF